jgi:hypothetical protein
MDYSWIGLLVAIVFGFSTIIVGVMLVELVRVLTNKVQRETLFNRIKVFGPRFVITKALVGDRQPELRLQRSRKYR